MATSATAFGSLTLPGSNEDTMEMSSPSAQRHDFGDDIDIDFDEYHTGDGGGQVPVEDDEQMLEDYDAVGDEMMDDGEAPGHQVQPTTTTTEEAMQDDLRVDEQLLDHEQDDEELLDYGDEEAVDDEGDVVSVLEDAGASAVEASADDSTNAEAPIVPGVEGAAAPDLAPAVDVNALEKADEPRGDLPDPTDDSTQLPVPSDPGLASSAEQEVSDHTSAAPAANSSGQSAAEVHLPSELGNLQSQTRVASDHGPDTLEDSGVQSELRIDATAPDASHDGPTTPTDTGLPPMNVRYGDILMPLFKSRNQPDGLLKDDNLASLSLAELIQNCRYRLALKIGEELSDDQEILLGFHQLGLVLIENSRPSFGVSLNEVLEVYTQLQRNDQIEDIPPLAITLSLQLKFASTFSTLKQAAVNGQGMSSFAFLTSGGGEGELDENYYDDGLDEGGTHEDVWQDDTLQHDEGHDQEYGEPTYEDDVEHAEEYQEESGDREEGYTEEQTLHEAEEQPDEEYYEDEEGNEEIVFDSTTADPTDGGPEVHERDNPDQSSAAVNESSGNVDAFRTEPQILGALESPTTNVNTTKILEESASTQIDVTKPKPGMYDDDDLIFDDDLIDSNPDPEHAEDGQHAAMTAHDSIIETPGNEAQLVEPEEARKESDKVYPPDVEHGFSLDYEDNENENSFEEPNEHEAATAVINGESDNVEHQENDEAPGEEALDDTDYLDEQQEGYHPDYQPGENEEQFHTARDFFDQENSAQTTHPEEGAEAIEDDHNDSGHNADAPDQTQVDDLIDFGDDIGFDEHEAAQADTSQPAESSFISTSSSVDNAKRPFEDTIEADGLENTYQPELKKARSS